MTTSKVEMSLDEIIKAGKNKGKQNSGKGRKFGNNRSRNPINVKKGNRGIQKRGMQKRGVPSKQAIRRNKIKNSNQQNTRNINQRRKGNNNGNNNKAINTTATKKLVQKLVKALAQRNVVAAPIQRAVVRRRGATRVVRRAIVLNRVNARSRTIKRRVVTPVITPVRQRIVYSRDPQPQAVQLIPVRNIAPRQRFIERRPVIVQQVQRRRARPVYQAVPFNNNNNGSVRAQIGAMRRRVVVVQQRQPITQRPNFQQRRNGRNGGRQIVRMQRQQRRDPLYEPKNFLQRI